MEHEVFVPVEAQSLRQTLRDPGRVARCVPGLQQDAGEPPIAGRLKVRLGGSTITYRGALRITEQDDDAFAVEGEGVEVRGAGAAKLTLTVRLEPASGGTTLAFAGTALAEGRATDVPADAAHASALRLLDRFAAALAQPVGGEEDADVADPDRTTGPAADSGPAREAKLDPEFDTDLNTDLDAESLASVFDTEVPPPSLDRLADEEFTIEVGEAMPAEAAHARRTMIGRSAEEVDHAPPRGRYAPVPAPSGSTASATLRWVAPAAALALASAVVVGRALRRRR
ncbi:carbon monoxide dehydrogenase [Streptomyces sp. SDr-06]|uniref:SRPBCC domain-containing protein n=1 Tax=Streptomyces sp. SDr-06 TaxID=2267702 RepID=UPI000DE817A2|nr:SRPBCC domain-containing protein [Streptomyces sp. SDr-06]RCH64419.1 carbon monoxide dehydrogenase [Streptomyces sp. SDr-06]